MLLGFSPHLLAGPPKPPWTATFLIPLRAPKSPKLRRSQITFQTWQPEKPNKDCDPVFADVGDAMADRQIWFLKLGVPQ